MIRVAFVILNYKLLSQSCDTITRKVASLVTYQTFMTTKHSNDVLEYKAGFGINRAIFSRCSLNLSSKLIHCSNDVLSFGSVEQVG